MQYQRDEDGSDWVDGITIAAPAFFGAAAGLLLGELMHPSARRGVSLGLIGLGVAALMPVTSDIVPLRSG